MNHHTPTTLADVLKGGWVINIAYLQLCHTENVKVSKCDTGFLTSTQMNHVLVIQIVLLVVSEAHLGEMDDGQVRF